MRKYILGALLATACSHAATFTGTISGLTTYAFTSHAASFHPVGSSWTIGYSYTSDSPNGLFMWNSGNLDLFSIGGGPLPVSETSVRATGDAIRNGLLVQNGSVSWFDGVSVMYIINGATWSFDNLRAGGTISYTGPFQADNLPSPVPDGGPSIATVALLIGACLLRSRASAWWCSAEQR